MQSFLNRGVIDVHKVLQPLINEVKLAIGLLFLCRNHGAEEILQEINVLRLIEFTAESMKHAVVIELSKIGITWILPIKIIKQFLKLIKIAFYFVLFYHGRVLLRNAIQTF